MHDYSTSSATVLRYCSMAVACTMSVDDPGQYSTVQYRPSSLHLSPCADAKEKYAKNLESLSSNLLENGMKAKGALDVAQQELLGGMGALLEKSQGLAGGGGTHVRRPGSSACWGCKDSVEDLLKEEGREAGPGGSFQVRPSPQRSHCQVCPRLLWLQLLPFPWLWLPLLLLPPPAYYPLPPALLPRPCASPCGVPSSTPPPPAAAMAGRRLLGQRWVRWQLLMPTGPPQCALHRRPAPPRSTPMRPPQQYAQAPPAAAVCAAPHQQQQYAQPPPAAAVCAAPPAAAICPGAPLTEGWAHC